MSVLNNISFIRPQWIFLIIRKQLKPGLIMMVNGVIGIVHKVVDLSSNYDVQNVHSIEE